MKIIWTESAVNSLEERLDYLDTKFGANIALNFYKETMKIIESIDHNNDIGKRFNNSIYRQFIIAKKTSLFYSIRVDCIYLHYFWDNRGNSERLKRILRF
ncbi:MAG: type II toxin-antitoxin system RelE/ParE family toxin [Polaribacter sp.]